uniref:Uncharacterized protein n=1 Tax=Oryza rufipogon TaxID=4529 RepID=A0A0E0QN11_ORYRU
MFCRRAAASSLEILPAWTAAARAADSSLPPEPVLLPRVDCRRIPAAGAAASSPPQPVPTSAPSATAGADFPPPPAPTSSSSTAVPIPSPIPSIPIISCRSPPSTLPHNPILYQKSKTTSIGMETSCFRATAECGTHLDNLKSSPTREGGDGGLDVASRMAEEMWEGGGPQRWRPRRI